MQADKINNGVGFIEATHTYFDLDNPQKTYISVTTLIEKFGQPFDKDFWSAYKALEKLIPANEWKIEKKSLLKTKKFNKDLLDVYDISQDDFNKAQQGVLDEWEKTNKEACERGTKIHAQLENSYYKEKNNISLKKFGIGGKFECKKDYSDLDLEYGIYPEYLISRTSPDGILKIAGQVDLIVKNGNDIIIIDYKTNKKIDQKGGFDTATKSSIKMKYPLSHLDDCNFNHYQLQLSTYAWMLQKLNPDFNIKGLIIDHYDHEGNETLYQCKYLKNEVEKMLSWYKRRLVIEQQELKRKRIEY